MPLSYVLQCLVNELNSQTRDFQETNTLMDDLVPNYNRFHHSNDEFDPPLLYSTGMNFYSFAVDSDNDITFVGTGECSASSSANSTSCIISR